MRDFIDIVNRQPVPEPRRLFEGILPDDHFITEAVAIPDSDYGYWVTDMGEIVPVPYEQHDETATKLLGKGLFHAFRKGWIRVIADGLFFGCQFYCGYPTVRALSSLKALVNALDFPEYRIDADLDWGLEDNYSEEIWSALGRGSRKSFHDPQQVVRHLHELKNLWVQTLGREQ